MTRPDAQPRHPLELLDLLIRVNAAAQTPGEQHEDLAEQFTLTMADPATGEQLRALRAQAEAEAGLRHSLGRVQALSRGFKAMSKSMVRLTLESVHEEASAALAQAGGES